MSRIAKPRTGHQFTLSAGDYSAIVTELGANLRSLTWQGQDLIASFDADAVVPCCNGFVLVPYPSRIEDGTYQFNGSTYQLPIDEPELSTALHGYGYRYFWTLEELTESSVVLSWRVPDLAGYPFDVTVYTHYELSESGLSQTVRVENNDHQPAPWAFGIHPWLSNGVSGHRGDQIEADNEACSLQLPARTHVTFSDRLLPTGTESVTGTKYDLLDGPSLADRSFDDAWIDVVREGADGQTTAVFTRPDGIRVRLSGDSTIKAWQVCTGTGFPAVKRPAGVAVEPMTAYANAFRSGKFLQTVEPGDSYSSTVSYSAERV